VAAEVAAIGLPVTASDEPMSMIRPPVPHRGESSLIGEDCRLEVGRDQEVEVIRRTVSAERLDGRGADSGCANCD